MPAIMLVHTVISWNITCEDICLKMHMFGKEQMKDVIVSRAMCIHQLFIAISINYEGGNISVRSLPD